MPDALAEAIALFNAGDYFACHEVLEVKLWRPLLNKHPDNHIEKIFYHGLLQVAVGFYHQERKNSHGFFTLTRKGLQKLQQVEHTLPMAQWVALSPFIQEVCASLDQVATSHSP